MTGTVCCFHMRRPSDMFSLIQMQLSAICHGIVNFKTCLIIGKTITIHRFLWNTANGCCRTFDVHWISAWHLMSFAEPSGRVSLPIGCYTLTIHHWLCELQKSNAKPLMCHWLFHHTIGCCRDRPNFCPFLLKPTMALWCGNQLHILAKNGI